MNCKKWESELNALASDVCEPGRRVRVEAHLRECAECRVSLAMTRQLLVTLKSDRARPAPEGFEGRLRLRLAEQHVQPSLAGWLSWTACRLERRLGLPLPATAAALCLAIGLSVGAPIGWSRLQSRSDDGSYVRLAVARHNEIQATLDGDPDSDVRNASIELTTGELLSD